LRRTVSLRIVIAEADPANAERLERLITLEKGYDVAGRFESAQSLLQAAREVAARSPEEWDLVLLSLRLPGSEGARTTQEIRKLLPDVPIVTYALLESAETFLSEIRTKL
jgi:DNA-binding NarL/FixJ family response regulator